MGSHGGNSEAQGAFHVFILALVTQVCSVVKITDVHTYDVYASLTMLYFNKTVKKKSKKTRVEFSSMVYREVAVGWTRLERDLKHLHVEPRCPDELTKESEINHSDFWFQ